LLALEIPIMLKFLPKQREILMSYLSTACTAVRIWWDAAEVVENVTTLSARRANDPTLPITEEVSIANQCFMILMQVGELIGIARGASSATLGKIKSAELYGRIVDVPLRTVHCVTKGSMGAEEFFVQGCISPISSMLRVAAQAGVYGEQTYLEMTPEERANATRPIYENRGEGYYEIVGEKPIDVNECRQNIEQLQTTAGYCFAVEAAAQLRKIHSAAPAVYDPMRPHYLLLAERLAHGQRNEPEVEIDPFELTALPRIPEALANDAVLRQNICPITYHPIRYIVADPTTNGITLYERSAIVHWIAGRGTSPMTQLPLTEAQLLERPNLQAAIDNRLRFIEARLREVAQEFERED
jgi:hypothetical protein